MIKSLILFSFVFGSGGDNAGWFPVARSQKAVHQIEEDDKTIWVVFAKNFGAERVLIRFPEDPSYRQKEGCFDAYATQFGFAELSFLVRKKEIESPFEQAKIRYVSYFDSEKGLWVREKHIETSQNHYVLRVIHPSENSTVFKEFANSFEIESALAFKR